MRLHNVDEHEGVLSLNQVLTETFLLSVPEGSKMLELNR